MPDFMFRAVSNKPRLRDPTNALRIIGRYWFDFDLAVGVETADGHFRLNIEGDGWPAAWPLPPDTSAEEYCPDFDTSGEEEFSEFLTEIAPYLLEPLVVHAIGTVNGDFPLLAREWRVDTDCIAVNQTEFTSSSQTSDRASFSLAAA